MYRFVLVALLLAVGSTAHAQFATSESLTLRVSPQNPQPYQTVTVTPESSAINLAAGVVTVTVNGKVVEKGSGSQSVPVTIGGPGDRTVISVSAVVSGQTYTSQVTLRPSDVSLIVEPVSTVHPFYRGAGLVAPQARLRVVALADLRTAPGTRINPANLVYTWRQGDRLLASESGIGRSTLVATAPLRYRDAQISVTVTNLDSSLVASAATVLAPVDPILRMYPSDPLMGPDFDHALSGTFAMAGAEEAFRGVAYFFGTLPSLNWSVNGEPASSDMDVTVRTTGSGAGTASLSLTANNGATGQTVIARLPVTFGNKSSFNIFGF